MLLKEMYILCWINIVHFFAVNKALFAFVVITSTKRTIKSMLITSRAFYKTLLSVIT